MHRPCYFARIRKTLLRYLFWEKRATDIILSIILHLITVIQINIIAFFWKERYSLQAAVHFTPLLVLYNIRIFIY